MDDQRVCFIGDSFVAGIGDPDHLGWAGRLAARSHHDGLALSAYNLGVRRQTSTEVAHRFLAECDPRLPPECQGRVVVSFGVNDTTVLHGRQRAEPAQTRQALLDVLDQAATRAWPVMVVGPPPVADASHNARTAVVEEVLAAECAQREVPFVRTLAHLQREDVWMAEVAAGDGAHPGARGYAVMADVLWPHWQQWLAS